jgi:hypothetical protein
MTRPPKMAKVARHVPIHPVPVQHVLPAGLWRRWDLQQVGLIPAVYNSRSAKPPPPPPSVAVRNIPDIAGKLNEKSPAQRALRSSKVSSPGRYS